MTNPSGLAPQAICVNYVAPLFPRNRGGENDWDASRTLRDVQIYPRCVREHAHHQSLHRTANVKHHLRKMADRSDMMTTYEHDFGFMHRPRPMEAPMMMSATTRHISAPPGSRSESLQSGRSGRSMSSTARGRFGEDTTHLRSNFASTEDKQQAFSQSGNPLRLSVAGWGDCKWSPKTHPSMVLGMTKKRITLQQTANTMNLRAPDVPFVTR
eukprot:TRINITY_DN50526_c0_g1_i1.p1 TRINITY_DN50526_c0_g1~~TRINITY_DN50526_c0_g1_i1.p1  ORF type:complete len:212 (-),score=33.73 TRINITY_DN50526_c0_g1_i1:79-714(-)